MLCDLFKENPAIAYAEVTATLAKKGIQVKPSLYYFVKGKLQGKKGLKKKARQMVEKVSATMGANGAAPKITGNVIGTILKVKHLATEVGGLKKLKALVEALGE